MVCPRRFADVVEPLTPVCERTDRLVEISEFRLCERMGLRRRRGVRLARDDDLTLVVDQVPTAGERDNRVEVVAE